MEDHDPIRPDFSPEEALRLAEELFGTSANHAEGLPSDRDQNFRLRDDSSGRSFVLKISHSREDPQVLDFQNRMLEHLSRSGFPCPNVLSTTTGREMVSADDARGNSFLVRLLSWVHGTPLCTINPRRPSLLRSLGAFLGGMDRALRDFSHPAQDRVLKWDLRHAARVLETHLDDVEPLERRDLLERLARKFLERLGPLVPELRLGVIHGDGNDHNILVDDGEREPGKRLVSGLVDFGDAVRSYTVAEPAIACAYVMLEAGNPLPAAAQVVEGYHRALPLREAEIAALLPLMGLRLCTSVAIAARQKAREPWNEYLTVSEAPAWALLDHLDREPVDLATLLFRQACGMDPVASASTVVTWLKTHGGNASPVVGREDSPPGKTGEFGSIRPLDLGQVPVHVLDLGLDSRDFPMAPGSEEVDDWTRAIFGRMEAVGAEVGIGRYDEIRSFYTADAFRAPFTDPPEWRTIHMGVDVFLPPGTPVLAPLDGVVHSLARNAGNLDYGPTVILEHRFPLEPGGTSSFWSLYGHLAGDVLARLSPGQAVSKGEPFARIGAPPENGNWTPHLHFQIITDLLGYQGNFPGVAPPSQRDVWRALSPDPNRILGIPEARQGTRMPSGSLGGDGPAAAPGSPSGVPLEDHGRSADQILEARGALLGPTLSLAYEKPLKIVRGTGQYLFDHLGQRYLDCVNNVPHVGHGHPRVVRAGQAQMAILNTNTRYLHDLLVEYAERLVATLPDPLSVVYLVCTGSEANELALRMARTHTGRHDVMVVEGAYHGNTSAMVEMSPYKFDRPGGRGRPPWVHPTLMPDPYRGRFRAADPENYDGSAPTPPPSGRPSASGQGEATYLPSSELGVRYAEDVGRVLDSARSDGREVAAFFCESLLGCGGQIVLPDGYLSGAFERVRGAGGVCIADEVQVGFGRVGTHFWGFETQGVIPDIVTMGKPMGNGHPIAAVVATREIAESFDTGMEYFNTFGGNPVSCAIGMSVLEVIRDEGLQENALTVGSYLLGRLRELKAEHPVIGDVRGSGLFVGVEVVEDRAARIPAPIRAARIKERLREQRILLSTDGPQDNVLKIKPPLVFSRGDADHLASALHGILEEDGIRI